MSYILIKIIVFVINEIIVHIFYVFWSISPFTYYDLNVIMNIQSDL